MGTPDGAAGMVGRYRADGAHHGAGRAPDPQRLGEEFNRQLIGDQRWEQLPASTQQLLRAEGPAFRADMAFQREPFLDLEALGVPFVVGCGAVFADQRIATANHRVVERAHAELFVEEGADHFAHVGHPDVWAEFVRGTLRLALSRVVKSER